MGEGKVSPYAPTLLVATLSPKGYGSGIAFTETRSKPVSQVLPAKAVAPYPLKSPDITPPNA